MEAKNLFQVSNLDFKVPFWNYFLRAIFLEIALDLFGVSAIWAALANLLGEKKWKGPEMSNPTTPAKSQDMWEADPNL